jgi:uncharacterized protein YndB with AHSA1/START domain
VARNARGDTRILGSVRAVDGEGVIRMEDRFATDRESLWAALTDPSRLARWISQVDGDLRPGGEFHARHIDGGFEGTGRINACEPPSHLVLTMRDVDPQPGQPEETVIDVTLTSDGDDTILVLEERRLPVNLLAAYGTGVQIHVENLAAHINGDELRDESRWDELFPAYQDIAAKAS